MKQAIADLELILERTKIDSAQELEEFRIQYLSKKGKLSQLVQNFRDVVPEEKKIYGQPLNKLKAAF